MVVGLLSLNSYAQIDTPKNGKRDTTRVAKTRIKPAAKPIVVKDSSKQASNKQDTVSTAIHADSIRIKDSLLTVLKADSLRKDSLSKVAASRAKQEPIKDTSTYAAIMYHPFIPYNKPPTFQVSQDRQVDSKDGLFYLVVGMVAFLAALKILFPRYFQNLFSLFTQTSFRQKQTRDQLLQDNLASLLSNCFFVASTSLFVALLAQRQGWLQMQFWWLLLYCAATLAIIYLCKYLFLLFSGWVFNAREAASIYLFVVFFVNKLIGIILVPFLLLLAFASLPIVNVAATIGGCLVAGLLLYRYVVSVGTIRSSLKVNALHFFLYLCAVEVLPLVLMYKIVFNVLGHPS